MSLNFYALEAFLQLYSGKDVFDKMRESKCELLEPFLAWEEKIDLHVLHFMAVVIDSAESSSRSELYEPLHESTLECILSWIVELWEEKKERLNRKEYEDLLYLYVHHRGSGSATRLWLNITTIMPGQYVLRYAVDRGHLDVVRLLLADPRVNPQVDISAFVGSESLLLIAIRNDRTEIVKLLLADPRIDPAEIDNLALHVASAIGHTEIVKVLLADPRIDPASTNNWALQTAAGNGHVEIVKVLLADPRVTPNVYTLLEAARYGYHEIVILLLADPRVDPTVNNVGTKVLRAAILNERMEVIETLFADPRIVNLSTGVDNVILHVATQKGHCTAVKQLFADPRVDRLQVIKMILSLHRAS